MEPTLTQYSDEMDEDIKGVVDISPYPVIIHKNGFVKYTNNLTLEFLKIPLTESLEGRHLAEFIHKDDQQKIANAIASGNSTGKKDVIPEFRVIDVEDNEKIIQSKSTTINFQGEKCRLVFIYNFDETSLVRSRLEEELLAYKVFQEKVNATSPVLISIMDLTNNISVYRSFNMESWLNYSPGTLPISSLDLINPNYREEAINLLQSLGGLKDGEIRSSVFPFLQGKGEDKYIYSRYTVFERDKLGNAKLLLIAHNDITDLKHAEFALNKANQELLDKNIQLEKYITSNSELEKFAYIASHDLKEPIRSMIGFAQLLEKKNKETLSEESKEYIHSIIDGAQRMNVLIGGLLDYSRISSAGKAFSNINIHEVIRKMFSDLKVSLDENNVELLYFDLPEIYGDELQIRQLFQNLISNSIKFRKDEINPIIKVSACKEGAFWKFKVEDNGIGMEMKYKDQIFQIFARLNSYDKYQGSGIGLSLCKKIIERHGGAIWVESSLGIGTAVYFTIPE
jgi:signal transduction histidine kinase